jgi:ribA/ribD-fused uncharacterized protein
MSGYFFFWKHRLSQWHMVNFVVDGTTYCNCEQYMMRQKALLFHDTETAEKIMATTNPKTHQQLGRQVKNFDQDVWNGQKEYIVYKANLARFTQSAECRELLLSTGNKTLVEASPYDRVWGIGLGKDDPLAQNESTWKGQNLLGKVLTQVRDELKNEAK